MLYGLLVNVTDVLEEQSAYRTQETIYYSRWHNIPKNLDLHQHYCEKLKSPIFHSNKIKTFVTTGSHALQSMTTV